MIDFFNFGQYKYFTSQVRQTLPSFNNEFPKKKPSQRIEISRSTMYIRIIISTITKWCYLNFPMTEILRRHYHSVRNQRVRRQTLNPNSEMCCCLFDCFDFHSTFDYSSVLVHSNEMIGHCSIHLNCSLKMLSNIDH